MRSGSISRGVVASGDLMEKLDELPIDTKENTRFDRLASLREQTCSVVYALKLFYECDSRSHKH